MKYFHSETANCSVNLDSTLIQLLPQIEAASTSAAFNQALLDLINAPGPTALPTEPLPIVPDSLMYNLNLDWIQDPVFSPAVKEALDTIRVRFRPRPHCLVGEAFTNGNPTFEDDILYNTTPGSYPQEDLRILSLFRYWNILNYFFPYKNIMDQDWDTTLTEVMPLFLDAGTSVEYDKAVMVLAKRIDDSHAFISGGVINSIIGTNYPRFLLAFVENETVVTKVSPSLTGLAPGDIVRSIDGVEIALLCDSIEAYTHGSNDLAVASFVHDDIMAGPYGSFNMTVENASGMHQYTLQRNWLNTQFYALQQNAGPVWYGTVINQTCNFGYVDMGRLTVAQVGTMMNDLWETDAIIFDIRSYPQSTLWYLVNYLFTQPINIANFTVPDNTYPGTLFWYEAYVGSYPSEVYDGQLIILFDIRTLSQAEYTCMGLEKHPGSIKIGNQTKAADGNVSAIYLPGNITTNFTGLGTFYPDYTPTQRVGIIPDIEVWPTIEGIRQGKDEILEYALNCNLLGSNQLVFREPELIIRPNPFDNRVQLEYAVQEGEAVMIEIRDLNGKPVFSASDDLHKTGKHTCDINCSGWPSGIYVCRIKDGNRLITGKMIKVH